MGAWLFAAILLVPACRQAPPPPAAFRVALVQVAGSPLSAAAEIGLRAVGKQLGAQVVERRVGGEEGRRQALRQLGENGVDLVFCVGGEMADLAFGEAAANPETAYVVVPGRVQGANVAGIVFRSVEGGYLAGVLAGVAGARDVAGIILTGGGDGWADGVASGFAEGLRSVRPEAREVRAQGADAAAQLVAAGVRLALVPGGPPDADLVERCRAAGLGLIVVDLGSAGPLAEGVVAAVRLDVPEAMVRVAREVRAGRFHGGVYGFDLGSGVVDLRLNEAWPGAADPKLRSALDDARAGITAGIVEVEQLGIGSD